MLTQRQKPVVLAIAALAAIWLAAGISFAIVKHAKVTPEKVRYYVASVDFSKLSPADRKAAIHKLADMLNRLSMEERRRLRLDRSSEGWFEQMTEEEKGEFLEATLPTGFKQMLGAFEEMPEDKRKRAVDHAVKSLKDARDKMVASGGMPPPGTNSAVLSEELQQKVATIGLKSFYSQSSAQSKAELAPLLEELQRMMESGAMMRGGPGRR
jgi:hypothetical protein